MFENSKPKSKSELPPLMLPIERSQKEIRREKNRLAQRRHREAAKRKCASKTHTHDNIHPNQTETSASSRERQQPQSPAHNEVDPMKLDFFEEIESISDRLGPELMEKEMVDDLINIDSSWEPRFFQETSMQSRVSHTTSETAKIPDPLLDTMGDDHAEPAMRDIHRRRRNSGCSSTFGLAMLNTQPNPPLIPVHSLDKGQPSLYSDRCHSQQPGFQLAAADTSPLPDLKGGIFQSEDTETLEEHQFPTEIYRSDDLDKSLQSFSQEMMARVGEASGIRRNSCRNKRRRTSYETSERRLERILSVIEEEGYESLDDVVAEYYVGQFPKDSLLASEQFHSRTRRLGRFLHQVHRSSRAWSKREAAGYHDVVTRAAEELFQEEVRSRANVIMEVPIHPHRRASPSPSSINNRLWMPPHKEPDIPGSTANPSRNDTRASAHTVVRDLLFESGLTPVLMQDLSRLQSTVPETFTLLTELARASGLRRPDQSISVCLFLQMLGL
ncbi:hypothetical protein BDBG_01901 [Blastomyces gilchristii SLH14081]|uniref:BZIP domain-containing protein n=1 Tax=Blastomyces gilchristii (strain SLH14081) TaxID=559298 RepID=A0A179UBX9_BLAGS|nr:uncharacterized protein BDBG_01901 [Blastomyces gilchristii SLH14081]OAT05516.1 hypothetical protein BDBG_01901 [Blastomyces gilchristii SLH14081]